MKLSEFIKEVAADPIDNYLNVWAMCVGAAVGLLSGLYLGFVSYGIGGAIAGVPLGALVGGICGMLTGVFLSYCISFIPWMIVLGVLALIIWGIDLLWNLSRSH